MRVLFISGQSSKLQSATALATACYAATTGLRVLLIDTGPSGLLSSLIGQTLMSRPMELKPNLAAMELVALDEFNQRWEVLCNDPKFGITGRLKEIQPDELPSFPSMDEMAAMMVADRAGQLGKFDLAVFAGTTIESFLRGITMREMVRWLVRLISGLRRGPGMSKGSQDAAMLPTTLLNAMPSATLMQDLRAVLERYCTWIDSSIGTSVRLVLSADDVHLPLMRYALNGFGLYGMNVDAIFVRGDISDVDAKIREVIDPLVVSHALPLSSASIDEWAERGKTLYDGRSQGLGLTKQNPPLPMPLSVPERAEVRLNIPFLDSKVLDIGVASEEVIVRLGQFRRHLLMAGMEKGGRLRAKVEGKTLRLWVEVE